MRRKRRQTRTSMRKVAMTGKPAPSWTAAPELQQLANDCFRACLNADAKPNLIRVYRNNAETVYGRCFIGQRIITIGRDVCDPRETLAHEIAHLRFRSHGPRHEELTRVLHAWIIERSVGTDQPEEENDDHLHNPDTGNAC